MPPPSPSFPLSDSRDYRFRLPLPSSSLPPPSALFAASLPTPSPSLYSPGPLPSPRCLETFPDSSKFFGIYGGPSTSSSYSSHGNASITTPPLTPGFMSESSPASPISGHRRKLSTESLTGRKLTAALSVPSLLAAIPSGNDGNSSASSAGSTPSGSPTSEKRNFWGYEKASGLSTPNTSPSESRRTSEELPSDRSSFASITEECENLKDEEEDQVQVIEREDYTVNLKRRRVNSSDEEDDYIVKRRRESSVSIRPTHHRSLSIQSESAPPSDGGDSDKEEYDVLGRKKPKTPRTPVSWDPEDDRKLIHLKEVQKLGWKQISTYFKKRTSHACQFRWRRLTSGTLKYYQGQRRPPIIPPMTPPEYASPSPKQLPINPIPSGSMGKTHGTIRRSSLPITPPAHTPSRTYMTPASPSYFSLPAGSSESAPWEPSEDAFLLDKKLSFAEVNVILSHRSESEIWQRMGQLRYGAGVAQAPTPAESERRNSIDA